MDLNRRAGHSLDERGYKFTRGSRRKDAGHILDAERIDAHRNLALGEFRVRRDRMHRRGRIADRALRVTAVLLDALDGGFEVARIVERVEHAEDVHAVFTGERRETVYDIVRVMLVAENVLTAEKHLQRSLFADLLDLPKPLPRILAQKTHTDVECRPAPAFERVVAGIVDRLGDFKDIVGAHARRPKRLVRVAQRRVGYTDIYLLVFHLGVYFIKFSNRTLAKR